MAGILGSEVMRSEVVMPRIVMSQVVVSRIDVTRILMTRVHVARVLMARVVHVERRGVAGIMVGRVCVVVGSHLACVRGSGVLVVWIRGVVVVGRRRRVAVRIKWHEGVWWGCTDRGIVPGSAGDECKLILGVAWITAGISGVAAAAARVMVSWVHAGIHHSRVRRVVACVPAVARSATRPPPVRVSVAQWCRHMRPSRIIGKLLGVAVRVFRVFRVFRVRRCCGCRRRMVGMSRAARSCNRGRRRMDAVTAVRAAVSSSRRRTVYWRGTAVRSGTRC